MDLRNEYGLISTSGDHSPFIWIWETSMAWYQPVVITGREMGAGKNLNHWIIKSVDYLHPTKMLILSTDFFSVLTQSVVFYIVHYMVQSLKHSTEMTSLLTATRIHTNYISYQLYHQKEKIFQRTETLEYPQKVDIKV